MWTLAGVIGSIVTVRVGVFRDGGKDVFWMLLAISGSVYGICGLGGVGRLVSLVIRDRVRD